MKEVKRHLTREKHLDHMVRVVPFIVFCYGFQSFMILRFFPGEFSRINLSILGGFLAAMIASFVTYDLKQKVELFDDHLHVKFLFSDYVLKYEDIWEVSISEPGQSFATLTLKTIEGKHKFYFIDDAEKTMAWILEKKRQPSMAA